MKILKYKKKANGKYSLFLDDGREFVFYEETILKYNLLLTKCIEEKDLIDIHNTNLEYDVYYVALKSIESRYKSTYELKQALKKKEYPEEMIDLAIQKLTKQGYLNDQMFAKSYIHSQMVTTYHGPDYIKKDLYQKKIDASIVEEEIQAFDEDTQLEKIRKLIERGIRTNHTRSGFVLKQKIVNDLKLQGYDSMLISRVISDFDFPTDPEFAKKEYDKLYKKYSSKYSGYELEQVIRKKLFMKGIHYGGED